MDGKGHRMKSYDEYCADQEQRLRRFPECCECKIKLTDTAYKLGSDRYMCEECWDAFVADEIRIDMSDWGAEEW